MDANGAGEGRDAAVHAGGTAVAVWGGEQMQDTRRFNGWFAPRAVVAGRGAIARMQTRGGSCSDAARVGKRASSIRRNLVLSRLIYAVDNQPADPHALLIF